MVPKPANMTGENLGAVVRSAVKQCLLLKHPYSTFAEDGHSYLLGWPRCGGEASSGDVSRRQPARQTTYGR